MSQSKFEIIQREFEEAVTGLAEVLKKPKDEFMRDSAIKRFEKDYYALLLFLVLRKHTAKV